MSKSDTDGVAEAAMEAARELALQSQIPGVSEAATLVSVLVQLVIDDRSNVDGADGTIKTCRAITSMLQRAKTVLATVSMVLQQ